MSTRFGPLALIALLGVPAAAQVQSTVGPPHAPLGCEIAISISNDTAATTFVGQACPYNVYDATGGVVYSLDCPTFAPIPIPPGETLVFHWAGHDDFGQPAPPGAYTVEVELPTGANELHTIQIGGTDAGLAPLGVFRTGTARHFELCAPLDGGFPYVQMASFGTAGVPTCGGTLPLTVDALFLLSLDPGVGAFSGFTGVLGADGRTQAPALHVPAAPQLQGLTVSFAFLVLDLTDLACPVRRVSSGLTTQIQ